MVCLLQVDQHYKLRQNIKIAMLYLEDDDSVNAEMYIKKAAALISSCKDEGLELQYKVRPPHLCLSHLTTPLMIAHTRAHIFFIANCVS